MTQLEKYFTYKCNKGLTARIKKLNYPIDQKAYKDRLDYEISVIARMGYPGYFLVVQDFINWAKSNNILVGDGRGSGAGSLCAFALGITNVDPIKYDLYFERFLNPDRVSMPDFDIDFQKDRREEVIEYVRVKYGRDRVAQIGTFGTFKAKKAIKDVARTLGLPIATGTALCKLYPKPIHGKEVKLKDAYKSVPALAAYRETDTDEGKILRWAEQVEGRVASFGVHASGVVIANEPLTDTVPLARGKKNEVVTQWDMINIEEAGLIKFDFLGLKNLSVVSTALSFIKKNHNVDIDIDTVPVDDPAVYANLCRGDNIGIFQLEASSGIRDLTVKVRPQNILDLSAIGAMYRPGPLASEQMPVYLAWRAGEGQPSYHHPDLEPILHETGGWIVYQEQVLRIARDLAGYSLAEADLLRRAVGKKKEKEMNEQKANLFAGFQKKGYTIKLAQQLWDEILAFSDYGFNKSHSVAYALLTYKTAWLKTHYPVEFMAAALTCDRTNKDQMIIYLQECKRMGIPVLPVDVNESDLIFTPVGKSIRFGLSAIKNVGAAAEDILSERSERDSFKSFFEFIDRIDLSAVNKTKLDSLILSGAFDFTHINRATLLLAVDQVIEYKKELKSYESKLVTYNKKVGEVAQREQDILEGKLSEKGKKLSKLKTPDLPVAPVRPEYIHVDELPLPQILIHEKELTGSFISGHPLDGLRTQEWNIFRLKEDVEQPVRVKLLALISSIQLKETKAKKRMAFLQLEDLTGTIDGAIFPGNYGKYEHLMIPNIPLNITAKVEYQDIETEDGDIVIIPTLSIEKIELVSQQVKVEPVSVDLPLTIENVLATYKTLDKVGPGEVQVRLKFTTQSDTILAPVNTIGVSSERTFRTSFHKQLKRL